MKRKIYLTGFMGSGKSTVGPILAQILGVEFLDLDQLIEEKAGKSISQIFQEDGEPAFRAIESKLLKEVAYREEAVISLGGGAIIDPANLKLVKATGVLIYLYASPQEILKRVGNSEERPLLRRGRKASSSEDDNKTYKRIEHLLAIRQPYYEKADVTVDTVGKSIGEVVEEITEKIGCESENTDKQK